MWIVELTIRGAQERGGREGMSGEPTEHTLDLRKVEDRYARGERKGAGSAGGAETISVPPDWRGKEREGLWSFSLNFSGVAF